MAGYKILIVDTNGFFIYKNDYIEITYQSESMKITVIGRIHDFKKDERIVLDCSKRFHYDVRTIRRSDIIKITKYIQGSYEE
jgi:hypothetical protein